MVSGVVAGTNVAVVAVGVLVAVEVVGGTVVVSEGSSTVVLLDVRLVVGAVDRMGAGAPVLAPPDGGGAEVVVGFVVVALGMAATVVDVALVVVVGDPTSAATATPAAPVRSTDSTVTAMVCRGLMGAGGGLSTVGDGFGRSEPPDSKTTA